jgi:hypothetical protein
LIESLDSGNAPQDRCTDMAKAWEQLSVEEKLDELRADLTRTMGFVNALALQGGNDRAQFAKLQKRLEALEARVTASDSSAPKPGMAKAG